METVVSVLAVGLNCRNALQHQGEKCKCIEPYHIVQNRSDGQTGLEQFNMGTVLPVNHFSFVSRLNCGTCTVLYVSVSQGISVIWCCSEKTVVHVIRWFYATGATHIISIIIIYIMSLG